MGKNKSFTESLRGLVGLYKTSRDILRGLRECVELIMGYLGEGPKAGKGRD